MEMDNILKIIPIITALVAVIVSPLITVYITKKQLNASVNSKNRQEWINTLRDEITEYLFVYLKIDGMWFDNSFARQNNTEVPHSPQDFTKPLDELRKHEIKISLLINPKEDDHKNLVKLLQDAYLNFKDKSKSHKEIEKEILLLSQIILKKEWERVKSLE